MKQHKNIRIFIANNSTINQLDDEIVNNSNFVFVVSNLTSDDNIYEIIDNSLKEEILSMIHETLYNGEGGVT